MILADGGLQPGDDRAYGLFAVAFDADGKRVATRMLERGGDAGGPSFFMYGNLAVAGGHPYILLRDDSGGFRVEELTADLKTLRRVRLPVRLDHLGYRSSLKVEGAQLVADLGDDTAPLAISFDLAHVAKTTRDTFFTTRHDDEGCGTYVPIGSVVAILCDRGKDTFLDWKPAPGR